MGSLINTSKNWNCRHCFSNASTHCTKLIMQNYNVSQDFIRRIVARHSSYCIDLSIHRLKQHKKKKLSKFEWVFIYWQQLLHFNAPIIKLPKAIFSTTWTKCQPNLFAHKLDNDILTSLQVQRCLTWMHQICQTQAKFCTDPPPWRKSWPKMLPERAWIMQAAVVCDVQMLRF